jgi:hypothetical protein
MAKLVRLEPKSSVAIHVQSARDQPQRWIYVEKTKIIKAFVFPDAWLVAVEAQK